MSDETTNPDDDLRSRLHAMETKVRRMRDNRNSQNENARRAADSRNAVQEQAKGLRESIDEMKAKQKEIRDQARIHKARRDEIQSHIREIISKKRGRRDDERGSKSVVIELSETEGQIDKIERRLETDGRLKLEDENKLLKELKKLIGKRNELLPSVKEHESITIDLGDMDESINRLKAEADSEHQAMVDCHKQGDEIWEEIKPLFEERDFLRAEGDRLHNLFVEAKAAADEVHTEMKVMLDQVNEIRDSIKAAREEREKTIRDHNQSVRDAIRSPSESEELAGSLEEMLLESGSLTLGGTGVEDESELRPSKPRKSKKRKLGTTRGKL
ncbi:MAG: hypothetical protein VYC33_01285 [Candidatus Thermoplasmatota archaeon]|nr:hypothetical protein [Candidatus Thermoplasmatota archaeon]